MVARRGADHRSLSRRLKLVGALLGDGTVIDGEVLPWKDGAPLPFAQIAAAHRPQGARAARFWPMCRSRCWRTICWNWTEPMCASSRSNGGARRLAEIVERIGVACADALAAGRGGILGAVARRSARRRARAAWKASC